MADKTTSRGGRVGTRAAGPGRSTLAAGAARASGERAKRRTTPLLSVAVTEAPVETSATTSASPRATTKKSAAKVASKKATTKAAPSKASPSAAGPSKATPAKAAKANADSTAPARASGTGARHTKKHRPQPVISSTPADRVRALSGERRVPRPSPRAKRAADQAAASTLRLAPTPVPAARRRREAAANSAQAASASRHPAGTGLTTPTPDPTQVQGATSLPMPSIEDLVTGVIGALRIAATSAGLSPEEVEHRLAQLIAYVRRRLEGDYTVDEFGYDVDFTESIVFPMLRPIYQKWFRIEVRGIENVPDEGGALLVANHSGTIAIDSIMLQLGVHDEHPKHRMMRALGADLVFQTPFLGTYARRTGSTLAANTDAERLFAKGELVGVFPEGFKGVGKPFRERYKLQRFGRGGFVSAALKAKVPIIPVSIVGAEEIAPIIGNMNTIARIFGLPYAPITPTFPWLGPLGLIPLPSKWIIEIGTQIPTDGFGERAEEDPMLVFDLTDQVRETIQQTLYALLMQRRSVFF